MRNYRHILVAFLLSLPLFWSCEKSLSGEEGETVDIVLQIGMKSSDGASTKADNPNVLPYEGIRTLRVLVISGAEQTTDRKILYNEKQVIDSSDDPTSAKLSDSLTLNDIPVGKASIYLIANEESIGIEYTDSVLMDPKYKYDNKLLLLDEGWMHFPKTYDEIAQYGLPMSGRVEGVDISSSTTIPVELERAVVKLHLTVENATSDTLVLEWVKFGKFISDRVYLFRQSELDIPLGTNYKELRYPEDESNKLNVTLAEKAQTEWNPVYIYPNFAYKDPTGSNPYTLSLATDKKEYSPSLISSNMNSMVRNTQFNILARITASATIEISYSYVPWTDVDVDVPSFN